MSSSICPHFAQNAWKKDLCSNCFKSKEEHKQSAVSSSKSRRAAAAVDTTKTDYPNKNKVPARSIMKGTKPKSKKTSKVCFPKQISEVIGYGGDWSEDTNSDDDDFMNISNSNDDQSAVGVADEEENLELKKLTKANTDFNMNNGNLLGDPQENIKKSFAALKLGAPQVDKEGKKQTLKINVTPFGSSKKLSSASKAKFEVKEEPVQKKTVSKVSAMPPSRALEVTKNPVDGKNSPPIERAMEKSLLEEISETLEQNKSDQKKKNLQNKSSPSDTKIKFEITSLADSQENKPFLDLKKPIARNSPITKDQIKPKINVSTMQKYSDSESNCSDSENGVSAYYDVVETDTSYENLPDGKCNEEEDQTDCGVVVMTKLDSEDSNSVYSSSQYITDILLSSKTRSATYSLHEGNFMTSKITSDGLIVTKCSSDDALDSTGSSFDGSSDEETSSYNMTRSESDSGIGISIGNDYKNLNEKSGVEKKLSASTNNSDYEDIQVTDQVNTGTAKTFSLEKSRELAGEPDGSADPDGSLENRQQQQLPALPKSPPPTAVSHEARPSFLHGLQKNSPAKKPELPAKPSVMKTFSTKRQPTSAEQQVITQLQQVMKPSTMPNPTFALDTAMEEQSKLLKKGRAPSRPPAEEKSSAPPTPERDYNIALELSPDPEKTPSAEAAECIKIPADESAASLTPQQQLACATNSIYTRKQQTSITVGVKSTASPVIREKDKRERATVNPKFRSLNTFSSHRKAQLTQQLSASPPSSPAGQFITLTSESCSTTANQQQSRKSFSLSEECLTLTDDMKKQQQQKKNKFSIRKFLRMGASKTTDNLHKKDGIYSEIVTGDESGVVAMGKPRLVIIHPIDINPTAVEVVKDITKTNDNVTSKTIVVTTNCAAGNISNGNISNSSSNGGGTSKPPAPPLRKTDSGAGQKNHEANKPARPPPPKSAELRRKQQKISFDMKTSAGVGGSVKCKVDNVYANLGEIRSSIAPRKPERTASMREREAQLELARKRQGNNENADNISICSSNGDIVTADISPSTPIQNTPKTSSSNNAEARSSSTITTITQGYSKDSAVSDTNSQTSSFERVKRTDQIASSSATSTLDSTRPSSLKDSVRKINSTIDSYLKDKREYENLYEFVKTTGPGASALDASSPTPPQPPARSVDASVTMANAVARRPQPFSDNASISGASYTRSEYGSPSPRYGLNNSLANIPRVISASYCGSEIGEFDIYSPYSYYGSEAGGDVATDINDSVWGVPSAIKNRTKATNRLRMRKGRSVVHKTIEDNYTAVVVANHEALAQVLDQLQQTPIIPPALRPLANAINLRFEDFTVIEGVQAFVVGKKAFHAAVWTTAPVTLALSGDCNQLSGVGGELCQLTGGISGVLNPITEFCDLVPSYHLPLMPTTEVRMLQATISVLPRLQLETLQSIGTILKNKSQMLDKSMYNFRGSIPNLSGLKENGMSLRNVCSVQNLSSLSEDAKSSAGAENKLDEVAAQLVPGMPSFDDVMSREVAFIMLQLVNGLKNLQAKAIEEMPLSLSNVVLAKDNENKDAQARLCVLQGSSNNEEDEPMGTLCRCAHIALNEMLPSTKMTSILADILHQERSESLSKAKSVLEFVLWGPSDVILSGSIKERELALQRWLDLERATVLHGLVRTRVELTIYDECHLMFLVRSNAKMMNDAAKIVSSYQSGKQ